jgi:hypothetical protein
MKKKKKRESFVLGKLDKKTLLVATQHAFVIKERVKIKDKEEWVGKYYYSEIGDALRGYARHALRRPEEAKKLDGSIAQLITRVTELENAVKEIGEKLNTEWISRMRDPVELYLYNADGEDKI